MKVCCMVLAVCGLFLSAFAGKYQNGIPKSDTVGQGEINFKKAPKKDKPWVPAWGHFPNHPGAWYNIHKSYNKRAQKGNIDVVFFGDSLTMGWNQNKKTFKKYFGENTVNFGIGGDTTRQILWRIDNGNLQGLSPKLVVLKIGTNNLYNDFNSGNNEEIAKGIKAVVNKLQSKLPKSKILLLGLLPRQNKYFSGRVRKINAIIKNLDNGKTVRYLDMGNKFELEFGKVNPKLYVKDQLHLSPAGYTVWAENMQKLFKEMMGF